MKLSRNKTMATLIALFLVLTITATLVVLPAANAHDPPWTIPTYAYVVCAPTTIGLGDYTLIEMQVDKYPPNAGGMGGDRWRGFTLAITKPDGSKETIPYTGVTSTLGTAWITYTPDQVGDYSIVFSWPGQTLTNGTGVPNTGNQQQAYVGDFYMGATSEPAILHVQQEPIAEWVEPPLPTDYWNRPINAANREWSTLASNWLKGSWIVNWIQPSGQGPTSAHVLWTLPAFQGGISDARWPGVTVPVFDYMDVTEPVIIMNGVVYFNTGSDIALEPGYGYCAVDLKTGEILWTKNGTDNGLNNPVTMVGRGTGVTPVTHESFPQLTFGSLTHYDSIAGEGIAPWLWMVVGSTWYMLDASTGNWIMTIKNVPSGYAVTDENGNILRYSYNRNTGQFLCWNLTQSIPTAGATGTNQQQIRPICGATIDAVNDTTWTKLGPSVPGANLGVGSPWYADDILPHSGYTMNVTGPKGLPSALTWVIQDKNNVPKLMMLTTLTGYGQVGGGYVAGTNEQRFEVAVVSIDDHVAPYSPFPDKTNTQNNNLGFGVTLKWAKNYTYPQGGNMSWGFGPVSYEDKVFTFFCKETRQWYGYSLDNGAYLWGPTPSQGAWDYWMYYPQTQIVSTNSADPTIYEGKLFSGCYAGTLYAYDIKTGKLLWTYNATSIGHESPYGGNYPIGLVAVCDGKIYLFSQEHSPTQPLLRGSYIRCINATDGTLMWKLLNFNYRGVLGLADGCIVAGNIYDNQYYGIGKGPSATTVEAPTTAITQGQSVMITGTVTDQSPGAKGTPAIADADMEAWMEYLYEQQAMPTNAKGVEVTLDTIDPNGNFVHIGTVTSDITGGFKKMWTPEVPGEYTVIATFAGSESYGSSYAETYVGVTEAPPATAAPEYPQPIDNTMTIVGVGIAIIIAIAIAIVLIRRK